MNKTKLNKILITIACFIIAASLSATVFATTIGNVTVSPKTNGEAVNATAGIANQIIGILQVIGIFASVIIIMILGIKYMMGSAEEKAEYKKTFIPFLIGALLVFAGSAFAKVIYEWISGITL